MASGAETVTRVAITTFFTVPGSEAPFQPMGGDGIVAPHSAVLGTWSITADASGGSITHIVTLDPRSDNLVAMMSCRIDAPGAAAPCVFSIDSDRTLSMQTHALTKWSAALADVSRLIWTPGPYYNSPSIAMTVPNTDGSTVALNALVYQFKKDAWRQTPLSVLVANLPSSGTMI